MEGPYESLAQDQKCGSRGWKLLLQEGSGVQGERGPSQGLLGGSNLSSVWVGAPTFSSALSSVYVT